jgi:hypothetical protein
MRIGFWDVVGPFGGDIGVYRMLGGFSTIVCCIFLFLIGFRGRSRGRRFLGGTLDEESHYFVGEEGWFG